MITAPFSCVLGILCFCLSLSSAQATEQLDLSVALKTLPLLNTKIANPVNVAIFYDPTVAASRSDADKIKSILDSGLRAPGDISLVPQLISSSDLSDLSKANIVFFAEGLPSSKFGAVEAAAAANHVLTISTDLDCVKMNKCVLGIVSKPKVEVYYSPVAADAAKISFASAFTMLAKQIGSM
jgi:hypothetical protein